MTLWMNHIASKKTSTVSDPLFNRYILPAATGFRLKRPVLPAAQER
jgi:hypothetical protein